LNAIPVPAFIDTLQRRALAVGGLATVVALAGAFLSPGQFLRSYLVAYLFWWGIASGCLSLTMIHHLTGGVWGLGIRRILEAWTRTLPFGALLFLPIALGAGQLYPWAHATDDPIILAKAAYLNLPFFLARTVFYFAVWSGLAFFLNRWSLATDSAPDPETTRRLRGISGSGLVLQALTVTFASVDWAMSLNPHWFSTIYGVLFLVGGALSALSFTIVLVARIGQERPLREAITVTAVHDLGKLMLAFTMLWAYVNLSQFLIIWSANLPEEIPWYLARLQGGWQYLAVVLALFHFALPFLLLLSRDLKRNAGLLGTLALAMLAVRVIDLFWLLAPDLQGHSAGPVSLHLHWLDFVLPVAIGGIWLGLFAWQLKGRPLLPLGDPELREMLGEHA
jgi:hypothetical protein